MGTERAGVCGGQGGRGRMEGRRPVANVKVALTRVRGVVEPGRLPNPDQHLGSAAAAPGEVRDPLRNLMEEDEGVERAPLTAVVVALWRVWVAVEVAASWVERPLAGSQWPSQCLRASRPKPDQAQVRAWLHLVCKVRGGSQGRLRLSATGGEVADSERNN